MTLDSFYFARIPVNRVLFLNFKVRMRLAAITILIKPMLFLSMAAFIHAKFDMIGLFAAELQIHRVVSHENGKTVLDTAEPISDNLYPAHVLPEIILAKILRTLILHHFDLLCNRFTKTEEFLAYELGLVLEFDGKEFFSLAHQDIHTQLIIPDVSLQLRQRHIILYIDIIVMTGQSKESCQVHLKVPLIEQQFLVRVKELLHIRMSHIEKSHDITPVL